MSILSCIGTVVGGIFVVGHLCKVGVGISEMTIDAYRAIKKRVKKK
jgi:hypothetical protein